MTQWRNRLCTDHGCLFYNRVVGLLQVAVENVTKHTGRIFMQIPSSLGHPVVFTSDWNVDALFLRKSNKENNLRKCLSKKEIFFPFSLLLMQNILYMQYVPGPTRRLADLESFGHDAAHDSTNPQSPLHVQFAQRRFELVNGNQPGSNRRSGCAQQIQLPGKRVKTSSVKTLFVS